MFVDEQFANFDEAYMDERLGELVLNARDWFSGDEVIPDIFAVGTDIGFFDRRGRLIGVRLTPYDAPPGVDNFPRFMRRRKNARNRRWFQCDKPSVLPRRKALWKRFTI